MQILVVSGMITEKMTWVRFPARISAVYSKLFPINETVFQFLIKRLHICSDIFSLLFSNFSPIFSFFYGDLAIPRKIQF